VELHSNVIILNCIKLFFSKLRYFLGIYTNTLTYLINDENKKKQYLLLHFVFMMKKYKT